ncbi:MAG TPA: FAD-binding oxidoreductase [Candidatus Binatia bacterium]|nr:FAD-binding oxidoreductase [Candidatus Binatia bacterium]
MTAPSWWQERAAALHPAPPRPSLAGDCEADVVIIGAGFTGLWSAVRLAELDPGLRVVLVDAESVGFGASGRNGGFAMTMVTRSIHDLVRKVGPRAARAIHLTMGETLGEIERFCAGEGIDADLSRPGLLTVSNGPEQDVRIRQDLAAAQRLGLDDLEELSAAGCRDLVDARGVRLGHFEANALLVDPAALSLGLAGAVERRGITLFEHSPMLGWESRGSELVVRTAHGAVRARRGLLATNAYAHAIPEIRRFLFTICAYIVCTEPLTEAQWARVGWERRMGVEDRRVMPHFHRPTPDGRILWGGRDAPVSRIGPDPRRDRDPRIFRRLEETFRQTFPQLDDVRITEGWGGPVGATVHCLPSVGWLRPGRLAYAVGYSGHGVGPSALLARVAVDLLMERDTERVGLPFVTKRPFRMPPGPLRWPFLDAAQRVLQNADDRGGARGPIGRALVRLLQ